MLEQKVAVALRREWVHRCRRSRTPCVVPQAMHHRRGNLRAVLRVATLERNQNEARCGSIAELIDQQLLQRRRLRRQEMRTDR